MAPKILALDIGTTKLKCHITNEKLEVLSFEEDSVPILYSHKGFVEIDPDKLWNKILKVLNQTVSKANLKFSEISCLGISTNRSTFITWDKENGDYYHNFITWKDTRADSLVIEKNQSFFLKLIRTFSKFLYILTRNKRYLLGSGFKFMNEQVTLRLLWAIENIPKLKLAIESNQAMFGTLDTWLIYKLTKNKVFVSDISNASATGLFDPFTISWLKMAQHFFNIPFQIFPKVVSNNSDVFGQVDSSIFGFEIPIKCCMSDQSASVFGSCCFKNGDLKVSIGTGSFLDIITGSSIHASVSGVYPLVGWQLNKEIKYLAEAAFNDSGITIEWALQVGLIHSPEESSFIASSVESSNGVYFICAFSGFGPPLNDRSATAGFIGLSPTNTRAHLVRAILESISFRIFQILELFKIETNIQISCIKVDGGISQNDFICQFLADIAQIRVLRYKNVNTSLLGVSILAGMEISCWQSLEDIEGLVKIDKIFEPRLNFNGKYLLIYKNWCKAINRYLKWI